MNDSKWEYTEVPKEKFAPGYRWENEQWKEEPVLHDGIFGAMGGLICSSEDFSKYVAFHLSAWPPRDGEGVSGCQTKYATRDAPAAETQWIFTTGEKFQR